MSNSWTRTWTIGADAHAKITYFKRSFYKFVKFSFDLSFYRFTTAFPSATHLHRWSVTLMPSAQPSPAQTSTARSSLTVRSVVAALVNVVAVVIVVVVVFHILRSGK